MEFSIAMQFVEVRAGMEAKVAGHKAIGPEHLFLALLKLAELKTADFVKSPGEYPESDLDIARIHRCFTALQIDTQDMRATLRKLLPQELSQNEAEAVAATARILQEAWKLAEGSGATTLPASCVLRVILENPSPLLRQLIRPKYTPKREKRHEDISPKAPNGEGAQEELPVIIGRIREMRQRLLSRVRGQDHVVYAFAEGIYNAEALAITDKKRKRPRAIFVFAGPPGVGKTFLAEEAAEALSLPFMRFDMSGYSDHQAHLNLIGLNKSYKEAAEGTLTGFVKKNPHCILLFDEIEKAHLNTVHIFLQMLDAGRLTDDFCQEAVSFRDTIIILTTNAGKRLYEGERAQQASTVSRQTLLNALETEADPRTGNPFFPSAICSRIAAGYPLLFDHLHAQDLLRICADELTRHSTLFEAQYGIRVSFDELIPIVLLYAEGGAADARTLRAKSEQFFMTESYRLLNLLPDAPDRVIKEINVQVSQKDTKPEIRALFHDETVAEVLLFTASPLARICRDSLNGAVVHITADPEEAYRILGERDIRLFLLDPTWKLTAGHTTQGTATSEFISPAASRLADGRKLLHTLHERMPELPVFVLETDLFVLDEDLTSDFLRAGAQGKLGFKQQSIELFADEVERLCTNVYRQSMAARLALEHSVLSYESVAKQKDAQHMLVRLCNFSLTRAPQAEDFSALMDDTEKPTTRFDDVIGAAGAKEALQFFVEYLHNPKKFAAMGIQLPKGVLLNGPPGTGKTMLARALAGEAGVAFLPVSATSFVTKWAGSGPEAVRQLFQRARRYAPSIIFIDEIDAIGRTRSGGDGNHAEEMTLNALLTEMDGFETNTRQPVFVLAATNYDVGARGKGPGSIDPALARRFDRSIYVDLPQQADRLLYLKKMVKKYPKHALTNEMLEQLAKRSTGMSLATLASVLSLAARNSVANDGIITDAILENAFEETQHGESRETSPAYLERVARHEAGHALLCCLAGQTPSYLTIIARGGHGGYMEHVSAEDAPLYTRAELLDRIRISLAGRAAEVVYYGNEDGLTTGASNDLQQATYLAQRMICNFGMDEEIGLAYLSPAEAMNGPQAPLIAQRVSALLNAELEAAQAKIRESRSVMDRLVTALMEKNKLTGKEIEAILL